jgi:hypothetical protein
MLLQAQVRQLRIQDPRMLYFLTCPVYFIDGYNLNYDLDKYLTKYYCLDLTNANEYLYKV